MALEYTRHVTGIVVHTAAWYSSFLSRYGLMLTWLCRVTSDKWPQKKLAMPLPTKLIVPGFTTGTCTSHLVEIGSANVKVLQALP